MSPDQREDKYLKWWVYHLPQSDHYTLSNCVYMLPCTQLLWCICEMSPTGPCVVPSWWTFGKWLALKTLTSWMEQSIHGFITCLLRGRRPLGYVTEGYILSYDPSCFFWLFCVLWDKWSLLSSPITMMPCLTTGVKTKDHLNKQSSRGVVFLRYLS